MSTTPESNSPHDPFTDPDSGRGPTLEKQRFPVRAVIMILIAIALGATVLGINSLLADDGPSALEQAESRHQAELAAESSGAPAPTNQAAPSSETASANGLPEVCLRDTATDPAVAPALEAQLIAAGYALAAPTEREPDAAVVTATTATTVYYDADQEAAATALVAEIGGTAMAEPRPEDYTACAGALPVLVAN